MKRCLLVRLKLKRGNENHQNYTSRSPLDCIVDGKLLRIESLRFVLAVLRTVVTSTASEESSPDRAVAGEIRRRSSCTTLFGLSRKLKSILESLSVFIHRRYQ